MHAPWRVPVSKAHGEGGAAFTFFCAPMRLRVCLRPGNEVDTTSLGRSSKNWAFKFVLRAGEKVKEKEGRKIGGLDPC